MKLSTGENYVGRAFIELYNARCNQRDKLIREIEEMEGIMKRAEILANEQEQVQPIPSKIDNDSMTDQGRV